MSLSELSVKRPVTTLVLTCLFVGLGLFMAKDLAVDLYPSITPPFISVNTSFSGANPREVEEGVTIPIENRLNQIPNLNSISSRSSEGISSVFLEFDYSASLEEATSDIRDALDGVSKALPDGADSPVIRKYNSSSKPIMTLQLKGALQTYQLKDLAEDKVKPLLERLEGVSEVSIQGGEKKIIQVDLLKDRLEAYEIDINQVYGVLQNQNRELGLGEIHNQGRDYTLRFDEKYQSLSELNQTIVASPSVRLQDIAQVALVHDIQNQRLLIDGHNGITLRVQKESDANSVKVAQLVQDGITKIEKDLPKGVLLKVFYDSTTLIRQTIDQVFKAAVQGALLAMVILFLFLRSAKSTIIIGLSIPISLSITLMGMYFFDLTLNLISLTGLILGLGMIVDNSIVILENIHNHREKGSSPKVASILGSKEMILPIAASTLTTLTVFLPMILWRGELGSLGQIYGDLIFTIVLSLLVSLITAITLVPALSGSILKIDSRINKPLKNGVLILFDNILGGAYKKVEAVYARALSFSLANRFLILTFVLALLLLSLREFSTLGMNLQPRSKSDDQIALTMTFAPGTSYQESEQGVLDLYNKIKDVKEGIKSIMVHVYKGGGSFTIKLPPLGEQSVSTTQLIETLRPLTKGYLDTDIAFSAGRKASTASPISLRLSSESLDQLQRVSLDIEKLIWTLPEIDQTSSSLSDGAPEYIFDFDFNRADTLGISLSSVMTILERSIRGVKASTMWYEGDSLDIELQVKESQRESLDDLLSLSVPSASGKRVPLYSFMSIKEGVGPRSIERSEKKRVATVNADIKDGAALSDVELKINALLASSYTLPEGISLSSEGEGKELKESSSVMIKIIIVAIILVFGVMASLFESFIDPFIIFFSMPLLFIGVTGVYKIIDQPFTLYGAAGIVILVGIVVNNGIVLVDYINLLRKRGLSLSEAISQGAKSRLRPILMTSLTTILGMIPMAFFPGEGGEMIQPIGQTVVGGLVSSTLMTLIVIPVLYSLVKRERV